MTERMLVALLMATAYGSVTAATPPTATIHLCGDSTMANLGPPDVALTQGWGEFLHWSFDPARFTVHNAALAGRSARSFTREGRFARVAQQTRPGDWIVIEFGHNDGGSLRSDNGRTDCFGAGNETCRGRSGSADGPDGPEIIQTYPTYLKQAASAFLAAGAQVILSAPTPNNVWESGRYAWSPDRFAYYSWLAADELGGPSAGIFHVPHGAYAAQAMKNLGADTVRHGYPKDHTHTSPAMAAVMAAAFVHGLMCGTSHLGKQTLNSTAVLSASFLGDCLSSNSTLPI